MCVCMCVCVCVCGRGGGGGRGEEDGGGGGGGGSGLQLTTFIIIGGAAGQQQYRLQCVHTFHFYLVWSRGPPEIPIPMLDHKKNFTLGST